MKSFTLDVNPGICGFTCRVESISSDKKKAQIAITGSGCSMIQELAKTLTEVSFQDIFVPLTRNQIFLKAEQAGCHLACPVPVAVVKASEASLVLALPQDVSIKFT